MLRGSGVSRIQNAPAVGSSQRNTMPSAPDRSVTPIKPCARRSAVSASHRQTSHVAPSAAVTRPATVANPWGSTPAGVAAVVAVVAPVAVGAVPGIVDGAVVTGRVGVDVASVAAAARAVVGAPSPDDPAHAVSARAAASTTDQDRTAIAAT